MSTEWFYYHRDEQFGPVSGADLRAVTKEGGLLPTDLIWKEGLADWVEARKLKGLFPNGDTPQPPKLTQKPVRGSSRSSQASQVPASPESSSRPSSSATSAPRKTPRSSAPRTRARHETETRSVYAAPQAIATATTANRSSADRVPGSVLRRFVARVIDICVIAGARKVIREVLWVIFANRILVGEMSASVYLLMASGTTLVVTILYYACLVSAKRATLGKMAMGLEVVDRNGLNLSFGKAAGRALLDPILGVVTLTIAYWFAFTNRDRQTLYDKVLGSYVIRKGTAPAVATEPTARTTLAPERTGRRRRATAG